MYSKVLVSFFLCLCVLNKLSESSVINHVGAFEGEETFENKTQVLESTTLASSTFEDVHDVPENTTPPKITEFPKLPENTDDSGESENAQVTVQSTDILTEPETTEFPHVPETTTVPDVLEATQNSNFPETTYVSQVAQTTYASNVQENAETSNVPDSIVSTEAPTFVVSEATTKPTPNVIPSGPGTKPSPPRRYVSKHRIEARTPKKHVSSSLFEMCPPLGENCPTCSVPQTHLSRYMCYYPIVLKVLLLSPPETDSSGRMCGKLGKLFVHGTIESKQFRSLLRFSINDTCGCSLKVSQHYFLFTHLTEFKKQGRVYSKISLSDESLLVPVDPSTEPDILQELRSCSPEQIGIIPSEENPHVTISVDSKYKPLYTQTDLQSRDISHQDFPPLDPELQISPRSARNPYDTNSPARYLPPGTTIYFPPMPPSQVQYPTQQMNYPKFPTMAPFLPFNPMPTFKPLFAENRPLPYVPPLFYNQVHPEVHKSVAYSSSSQGNQVSVQTGVSYDSKTGSIKVDHSGAGISSATGYAGGPLTTFPQENQHAGYAYGTIQVPYKAPENAPKNSVNVQNAHVVKSSVYQTPDKSYASSASSAYSGVPQQQYTLTNCLNVPLPSTCPYCAQYDATKFHYAYCNSTYAFLSTMTFPDRSLRQSGNEYECLIVQSQLLHDISKNLGRHDLFRSLQLLLPSHCDCFSDLTDPAVILLLGITEHQPSAPQTQLTKDHKLILLSAPSDTTLPICQPYKTRDEVKSGIRHQPTMEYESLIHPSSSPPSVIQYPTQEPSKVPDVLEYTSEIPYPSPTEKNTATVENLNIQTPDNYPKPAPPNTTYEASESSYNEISNEPKTLKKVSEPLKYQDNYEIAHKPAPASSVSTTEAYSKAMDHSAHYQQPPYGDQQNTSSVQEPTTEEGHYLPPIQHPSHEASKPVPPVPYPVQTDQETHQTLSQQPYVASQYPSEPQMQNYEAAKSSGSQTYIQEYESGICPSNVVHSCPISNGRYDASHAPHYCAAPFAIIVDLIGPGFQRPYYTFPRISVKTTSSSVREEKTVVVSVSDPPPLSCSQRSVKVIKNIGTEQENFLEGNKIPLVLVSTCRFEYATRNSINRLLLHSPTVPNYLHNGGIQITEHIKVLALDPSQPLPSCIVSRPMYVSQPGHQNPPQYPPRIFQYINPPAPQVSPQNYPMNQIPLYPPYQPEKKLDYVPPSHQTKPPQYPPHPKNTPPVVDNRPAHTQYPPQPESHLDYVPPPLQTGPSQYTAYPAENKLPVVDTRPAHTQYPPQPESKRPYMPLLVQPRPPQQPSQPENNPIYIPPVIPTMPPDRSPSPPYAPIYIPPYVENQPETRLPSTIFDKPYVSPMGINKPLDYEPPVIFKDRVPLKTYKIPEQPVVVVPPIPTAVYPEAQVSSVTQCPKPHQPPTCPTYTEKLPLNFPDLYCKSKFAMVVAIGVDKHAKHIVQKEGPRVLPFLKPKPSNLEIRTDKPFYSVNITVTRGKTLKRMQSDSSYSSYDTTALCNNEVVAGLYDVSPQKIAMEYWVDLNLFVPISCQFSAFDNSPSYGILMSLQEPDLANPIQLAQDFAFFPLPKDKLQLPTCYLPPHISPPYPSAPYHVVKYVPPALQGHKMEVECNNDTCGTCDFVRPDNGLSIPCDMRFVAVVEILETSADMNVAPSLDVQHYFSYENHVHGVVLNVKSSDEQQSYMKSSANAYASGNVKCRYAKVRVVKDLSPSPTYPTKDKEITLIIPWNCKCHLFEVYSGYAVLMTKFAIQSNLVVPITRDFSKVSCLPIGSVKIQDCPATSHANWLYNSLTEQNVENPQMSYSFSYSQNPEPYSHKTGQPRSYDSNHPAVKDSYAPAPALHALSPTPESYLAQPVPTSYPPNPIPGPHVKPAVQDFYAATPVPDSYVPRPSEKDSYPPVPRVETYAPHPFPSSYVPPAFKNSYAPAPAPEPYQHPAIETPHLPEQVPQPYPPQPSHEPHVLPSSKDFDAPAVESYPRPVVEASYPPAAGLHASPPPSEPYAPSVKESYAPTEIPEIYMQTVVEAVPTPGPYQPPPAREPYGLPPAVPESTYSHATSYGENQNSYASHITNYSMASVNVYPVPEQPYMCSDDNLATLQDCPVCEEIRCVKPEAFCNSKFSAVARPTGSYVDESSHAAGNIVALYDITSFKPAQRSVKSILYKIPKHCSCPILKENRFVLLMIENEMPEKSLNEPFVVDLDAGDYVYATVVGKVTLPLCTSHQARSVNGIEEIVLDPVQDSDLPDVPKNSKCPSLDYSCPMCHGSVDDEELKNLVCSSHNAALVSLDDASKNDSSRSWWTKKQVTVTQHVGQNYSIGIEIEPRKFESRCNLPEEAGDCKSITTRFHYDVNDELCYAFDYTGCNGNANNFKTEEECEQTCIKNYNCTRGNLRIHKGIRGISKDQYETFEYALPAHCDCPQLITGEMGYLLFNSSSSELNFPSQLNDNYKLLRLSEAQLNMEIICGEDITETKHIDHSVANSTVDNEVEENTISADKPKKWFFG